ncbi:DUF5681 domain-containing protein [Tabrizicola sp. J26]|uniref:DUF5681 domain-containing protein n=1 Tax=Alitabrizicola rongguiensis TaxID=2909234 RepID=UPI001F1D9F2C|nr:DUF5681 domain-containing protein [Tabrizicola rongguiensis]MCF1709467.1 DUF5681 domain-containing protein [Tabrizicola rongguiensis]
MTAPRKPGPGMPASGADGLEAIQAKATKPGRSKALIAATDYEVGYARPPRNTQFQKGKSGNPRGRPKGARNRLPALNEERMKAIILEEAYRTITVRDGLRNVTVPIARAVLRSLAVNAVKGQHRAQRLFAELLSGVETSNKALHDAWFSSALDYKIAWEAELARRDRRGITDLAPPLPHPDHMVIDMNRGTIVIYGPKTREEKEHYDRAFAELRRQVILREICREAMMSEDDAEECADLARHIEIANATIAKFRTVLPEDLYPVKIDRSLRAEMRALQKKWTPLIAAEIIAEGGLDEDEEEDVESGRDDGEGGSGEKNAEG